MNGHNPPVGKWDQVSHPYRLSWIIPSSVPGNHGWVSRNLVYPTYEEAAADVPNIKGRLRGSKVHVHRVENPGPRWRWRLVSTFRPIDGKLKEFKK